MMRPVETDAKTIDTVRQQVDAARRHRLILPDSPAGERHAAALNLLAMSEIAAVATFQAIVEEEVPS
jgi:hypothetical protein